MTLYDQPTDLSPDELAAIIFPPLDAMPKHRRACHITYPACLNGGDVPAALLRGTLVQLGAKDLTLTTAPDEMAVKTRKSVGIQIRVLRAETSVDWNEFSKGPIKHLKAVMGLGENLLSVWGTAFSRLGKPCKASDSDVYSCHMLISHDAAEATFKVSGPQCLITPADPTTASSFKPLWIPAGKAEAQLLCDTLKEALGLVQGKKGWGVRLRKEDFAAVRSRLFPDAPSIAHDDMSQHTHQWVLSPTPRGATRDDVQEWVSKHCDWPWDAKVRRQLGPTKWLLLAKEGPKTQLVQAAHSHMILQPFRPHQLERRPSAMSSFIAGDRSVFQATGPMLQASAMLAPIQGSSIPGQSFSPAPAGQNQTLLEETERKFTQLLKEHEQSTKQALQKQAEETKQCLEEQNKKIQASHQNHENRLDKIAQDMAEDRRSHDARMTSIQTDMQTNFDRLFQEMRRFSADHAKRSPAEPSPEERDGKQPKKS